MIITSGFQFCNIFIMIQGSTTLQQGNHCQPQNYIQETMPEIQVISTPSTPKHPYHLQKYEENQQQELMQINTIDLVQGNPILPPGKHYIKEQPSFRLKFVSNRQKFNKTSFMPSLGTSLNLTNRKVESIKCKIHSNKNRIEQQEEEQDIQYIKLLQNKRQIFRRIKNSNINKIGKDRVLCSIFLDCRKEKIVSKVVPIYQYVAKIKNIKNKEVKEKDWLQFQSSFQSGNLLMALKDQAGPFSTYELYMQNDVNTKGCTQWFYFKVTNYSRGKVRFRIMNFYKPTSLYQRGMKILCSSDGVQWKRTGTAVSYFKNEEHQGYYSLDFIYQFDANSKTTYFSYGYPYTYSSHLTHCLNSFISEPKYQKIMTRGTLCLSAMNNPIPILYISNFQQKKEPKELIYIIGRQHPGETPSSYIVEGLILFLTSNVQEAKELRDKYEFRIVPMLNVDGVISGNYRSNISGFDINRQWQFPSKKSQPEVFWLKQQVANNKKQIVFFLDIHAHSRKMNSFFYGSKQNKENKLFPFVCSKLNKFISYNESSFNDDPSKKTTARVVLQSELSVQRSLTFQASFYGYYDDIKQSNYSFKQNDLRNIGESLGIGFYYSLIGIQNAKKPEQFKYLPKHFTQKQKSLVKNSAKMLQKWNKQLQKEKRQDGEQIFSEGSSVDPEHFQLKQQEKQILNDALEKSLKQLQGQNKALESNFKGDRKREMIYSTLQPQESKLLNPKGEYSNDGSLGMSGSEFYQISTSKAKKQSKTMFSVRQLQLQLQGGAQTFPQRKIRGLRLKMGHKNIGVMQGSTRYGSLDLQNHKNYRNDVIEMKKALKFLLQSKNSNYDDYKSCFKSFNTEVSYMSKNQIKGSKK